MNHTEDRRPDILLIMTDQHRADCLSIAGHPVLQTPNLDTIAAGGALFNRAYTTCPSCIAARRSLLSGQFPATHGMVGYQDGVAWDAPVTLPEALRRHGYQTLLSGRNMHQHPERKRLGFEHMVIHAHETDDYGPWLERHTPDLAGGWFGGGVRHNDWTARPWMHHDALHASHWTVSTALDMARRRDPSSPMFLAVSFIAPHPPLQPPAFYFDRYLRADLPEPVIGDWARPPEHPHGDAIHGDHVNLTGERLRAAQAGYFGLINHVDDQIRRLLCPIQGIGRTSDRDLIIIFLSDHGEMLGDHYRWRKSQPYEASARVPLLIQAPPRFGIRPRTVMDQPVCLEDVMPTLLELAGAPVPDTVEGRSLLPLLRGDAVAWRDDLHIEHAPLHQTVTDGREKFIWFVADGREQYFDLRDDPQERRDRIGEPAAAGRIAHWRERLISYLRGRPEGFVRDGGLVAGRDYPACLPHANGRRPGGPGT